MTRLPRLTTSKKLAWTVGAVLLVPVMFAVSPAYAGVGDIIYTGIAKILGNVVFLVLQFAAWMTTLMVYVLIFVAQFNHFTDVPIVKTGWALVKDVSNMFFIIALLVISIGTILRLENYRYNRLLGRVVVMAFLVNFSMLIAGFFIQSGQVVMLTFVNAFKEAAFGNFASMFGLEDVLKLATNTDPDFGAIVVSLIGGLAMMITAMVVMMAMCVILIVRVIALWILIILSPLAFAMRIIPNTEKYYGQWWGEFTKYVTVGPVLAFFLWLALALQSGGGSILDTTESLNTQTDRLQSEIGYVQNFASENLSLSTFISFLVSTIFLVMALQYATKSGTAGASFASKVATTGFAAGAALTGLNAVRNAVRDRTLAPIQGYFQQRGARRQEAIRERTVALGARVDKGLSATIGQVGRLRAGATAAAGTAVKGAVQVVRGKQTIGEAGQAVVEAGQFGLDQGTRGRRQALRRVAQYRESLVDRANKEFNVPLLTPEQRKVMATTGGFAERLASTEVRAQKGEIKWDDPAELSQIGRDINSVASDPALRKRMIESMERALSKPTLSTDELTTVFDNQNTLKEIRMAAGDQLLDPRHLRTDHQDAKKNQADESRLGQILKLATESGPDKERAVLKKGYNKVFDMMMKVHHKGLATADSRSDLAAVIEEGDVDERKLQLRHFTGPETELDINKRKAQAKADKRDMFGRIAEINRRHGSIDDMGKGKSDEEKEEAYGDFEPTDWDVEERRKFALATGQIQQAFKRKGELMKKEYDDFVSRYGENISKTINETAAKDAQFLKGLFENDNFFLGRFTEMGKRPAPIRKQIVTSLDQVYAELLKKTDGQEVWDQKDPKYADQFKEQNKLRAARFLLTWGEQNAYAKGLADPATAGEAEKSLRQVMATAEGAQVSRMHLGKDYTPENAPIIDRLVAESLRVEEVPKLVAADVNYARKAYRSLPADSPLREKYSNMPNIAPLIVSAEPPAAPTTPPPKTTPPAP